MRRCDVQLGPMSASSFSFFFYSLLRSAFDCETKLLSNIDEEAGGRRDPPPPPVETVTLASLLSIAYDEPRA